MDAEKRDELLKVVRMVTSALDFPKGKPSAEDFWRKAKAEVDGCFLGGDLGGMIAKLHTAILGFAALNDAPYDEFAKNLEGNLANAFPVKEKEQAYFDTLANALKCFVECSGDVAEMEKHFRVDFVASTGFVEELLLTGKAVAFFLVKCNEEVAKLPYIDKLPEIVDFLKTMVENAEETMVLPEGVDVTFKKGTFDKALSDNEVAEVERHLAVICMLYMEIYVLVSLGALSDEVLPEVSNKLADMFRGFPIFGKKHVGEDKAQHLGLAVEDCF